MKRAVMRVREHEIDESESAHDDLGESHFDSILMRLEKANALASDLLKRTSVVVDRMHGPKLKGESPDGDWVEQEGVVGRCEVSIGMLIETLGFLSGKIYELQRL